MIGIYLSAFLLMITSFSKNVQENISTNLLRENEYYRQQKEKNTCLGPMSPFLSKLKYKLTLVWLYLFHRFGVVKVNKNER